MRQVPAWCWPADTISGLPAHHGGVDRAGLLEPRFGAFGLHLADLKGVRMHVAGDAHHRQSPLVPHRRIERDPGVGDGNLLRRAHDDDGALVPVAHGLLVAQAPARRAWRQPVDHVNRQADELVGQHAAAAQAGSAVVVVADGDAGAGADVVVGFEVEVADRAGVVVALQIAAHLVVAIAQPVRETGGSSNSAAGARTRWRSRRPRRCRRAAPADRPFASK